jgi:hypothetical protein
VTAARLRRFAPLTAGVALVLAAPAPAAAWNPLKSAGRALGAGAVEAIQPALAATIDHTFASGHELVADVDRRLGAELDRAGTLVDKVLADADKDVQARITQIDVSLEQRIVQIDRAASGAVSDLDARLKQDIDRIDGALRKRVRQIDGVVQGALADADQLLERRIDQLDEAVGKRLGNVDVIATKQRLAIEETLLRVAVLVGLVAFVVIVLVRLWRRYGEIVEEAARADNRRPAGREIAAGLASSFALQVGAALAAAGILLVLYRQLPLGAQQKARELVAHHEQALEESLATFEFARVRYHASQLELLRPGASRRYRALAAKGELMRDVLARPTLLASASGISSVVERVMAVERLLGTAPDADVLTVKALVLWQVGQSRADQHEAASLCARALRLRQRGFALAPLARSMIEDFLAAPYFADGRGVGRDAESAEGLRAVVASVVLDERTFPLAATIALRDLVRTLDGASANAYVAMLEAHAALSRAGSDRAAAEAERRRRTEAARQVVAAWDGFDRAVEAVPGLGGTPAVLGLFQLNDVYYTRAKWFTVNEEAGELPPRLTAIADPAARARLAPPRVAWGRRYGALLGRTRGLLQFQEAERWRRLEDEVDALDRAVVALRTGEGARERPGIDLPALRRAAALRAARLGLFVDVPGTGRTAYAERLLGAPLPPPPAPEAPPVGDAAAALRELGLAAWQRAPALRPRAGDEAPARAGRAKG